MTTQSTTRMPTSATTTLSTGTSDTTTSTSTSPATTDPDTTISTGSSDATATEGSSSGGGTGSSSESGEAVCGDGRVNGDEVCDDGENAGVSEGDCAPDCSATVQQKLIRLSQNSFGADFAPGTNPVDVADAACPVGYLAFFADGVNRVATVSPNMGNGQVNWVLQPWTEYVNPDGVRMWTTTELLLLGVDDSNTFVGLEAPLTPSTNFGMTGMLGDYTTSTLTCGDWSEATGSNLSFGQTHVVTDRFIGPPDNGSGGLCNLQHEFICIEQ